MPRLLLIVLCGAALVVAPSAGAHSGTWGAGGYPYSNGVVCAVGGDTSVPLVSWSLTGDRRPAWVLGGLSSQGGVDNGAPPLRPIRSLVAPGSGAFRDDAQIRATAALLRQWSSSPSPARIAEVAELIAEHAGGGVGAECLVRGVGGTSRAEADAMWLAAQKLAGPFTIKVLGRMTVVAGRPTPVRVEVLSTLGYPIAGQTVTFNVAGTSVAVTDAAGVATTTITLPPGTSPTTLIATTQAPFGLTRLSAPPALDAITLGTPESVSGSAPLMLDPRSDPHVTTSVSPPVGRPGVAASVGASVTGLNGHRAAATLTLAGPLPLDAVGGCAGLTTRRWNDAIAANPALIVQQADAAIARDGDIGAPRVTVKAAGCYATSARVSTTDAVPNVSRDAPFGADAGSLTVSAVTAAVAASDPAVVGAGPLTTPVTVARSGGATSVLTARISGPVQPRNGKCAGLSGGRQLAAGDGVATISGDGTAVVRSGDVRTGGCYLVDIDVAVQVGRQGALHIAISRTVLQLHPDVVVYPGATFASVGMQAGATAVITGTFDQPGTVATSLLRTATPDAGCRAVNWAKAPALPEAPRTRSGGDGTYHVATSPPRDPGCYAFVVRLTLDSNHAVNAVSAVRRTGQPDAVLRVTAASAAPPRVPVFPGRGTALQAWLTLSFTALLTMTACAQVGRTAWRNHLSIDLDTAGLRVLDGR